ncbi:MAG: thioredoxin [Mycoplasmataceae bacterium]|jgi:thioredoxin 1|nr:thioredoxin [Mycoplasmataceae bacterium]
MPVKNIETKDEFLNVIDSGYVLVDFYAVWCGPCKMLSPIIEKISLKFNDIIFAKVDVDQLSEVAQMFLVQSIPTIYLFKDGKPLGHFTGFLPESEFVNFINKNKR